MGLAACLGASLAHADTDGPQTAGEWLARGFVMRLSTTVAGTFRGCRSHTVIPLRGGSSFSCDITTTDYGFRPGVVVLQEPVTQEAVLLIHGIAYQGTVLIARGGRRFNTLRVGGGPQVFIRPAAPARLPGAAGAASIAQDTGAAEALDAPVPPQLNPIAAALSPTQTRRVR